MLPDSDHNQQLAAPDVLTGAVFNYEWRKIIVGVLESELPKLIPQTATATEIQDYETRVIELINDIYTLETPTMTAPYQLNTERDTTTQTLLAANSPNAISWNQGHYTAGTPTRLICPEDGIYIITANFRVTCVNPITWEVRLRKNGTDELLRINFPSSTVWQVSFTWQFSGLEDDYVEILIAQAQNATLQITTPICASTFLVIPSG